MPSDTDLPTLKARLRALLADTPRPAHPHVSPADLTTLLDALDAAEAERDQWRVCKRFAEQNVEELNADELREYAIGLGERVARNEREMAAANGRLRGALADFRMQVAEVVGTVRRCSLGTFPPDNAVTLGAISAMAAELTARRERDADVRACAEHLVEPVSCLPSGLRERARRILAAKDAGVIGGEG